MPEHRPVAVAGARTWLGCAALWLALLLPAGCTSEATLRQAEFDVLIQKLPGQYDNLAQAASDAGGEHAAVALLIRPVNALTVGPIVLFVRETAADDPRRVLSQHIWTFALDKKQRLIQTTYVFKEPQRWLHAVDDPYVMQSVLPDDLSALSGCDLIWKKIEPTGAAATSPPPKKHKKKDKDDEDAKPDWAFEAATRPNSCKASADAEGLLIEQSAELHGTELVLNEQLSGSGGPEGSAGPASAYHFQRHAGQSKKQ